MNLKTIKMILLVTIIGINFTLLYFLFSPFQIQTKRKVGWIKNNKQFDKTNFQVCDESNIREYYAVNPVFKEGKKSIREYFNEQKISILKDGDFSGYITVRFIVNCKGECGRFRVYSVDNEYQPTSSPKSEFFLRQLVEKMPSWTPGHFDSREVDSYVFVTFKLRNGCVIDICP